MSVLISAAFWESAIAIMSPLALASMGALLCSRAGVLYVGIDGVMLTSAFAALATTASTHSVVLGVVAGILGGVVASALLASLSISLGMGDVVAGLVLEVGTPGITGFLAGKFFPNGLSIGLNTLTAPWPSFGNPFADVVLHQNILVYASIVITIALEWFLRTRWGLIVRASGESLPAARSVGIRLVRLRYIVHGVAGACTGMAGSVLGLAVTGVFTTNLVNGAGFVALACVLLGGWRPRWTLASTVIFGAAYAYSFELSSGAYSGWIQVLPYVVTLLVLGTLRRRIHGPAEEGRGLLSA